MLPRNPKVTSITSETLNGATATMSPSITSGKALMVTAKTSNAGPVGIYATATLTDANLIMYVFPGASVFVPIYENLRTVGAHGTSGDIVNFAEVE